MELRQLETFLKVAERRGFSAAAAELGLTQPTVSFQIASLEAELGTKLFERGGRTTSLTTSGEVLSRYARQILELSEEAEQAIQNLKGLLWGAVRLAASTIPGEYILPRMLQGFREAHPGIELEMIVGDSDGVIGLVLENEVELGIVGATRKSDKLSYTRFVSDRLVVIAPARSDWLGARRASLAELRAAPFIMRERGSGTRAMMQQKLDEAGLGTVDLNVCMTLGSTEAVKRAVACGAGVSIVSERAVENEVKLGLIKAMEIEGVELARDFMIVHRRQKELSPAGGALMAFLPEAAATGPDAI